MSDEKTTPEKTPTEKMKEYFDQNDRELREKSQQPDKEKERIDWENTHPKGPQ